MVVAWIIAISYMLYNWFIDLSVVFIYHPSSGNSLLRTVYKSQTYTRDIKIIHDNVNKTDISIN